MLGSVSHAGRRSRTCQALLMSPLRGMHQHRERDADRHRADQDRKEDHRTHDVANAQARRQGGGQQEPDDDLESARHHRIDDGVPGPARSALVR